MVDREALNPKGVKMWCSSCRIPSCSHSDLGSDFSHASNEGRGGLGKIEVRGFCRTQQKIPMNREVLYLWLMCRPGGAVQARQGRKVVQVAREGVSELGSLQICTSSSIGRCCCCTWCTSTTWATPILRLGDGELTTTKSKFWQFSSPAMWCFVFLYLFLMASHMMSADSYTTTIQTKTRGWICLFDRLSNYKRHIWSNPFMHLQKERVSF